MNQILIVAAKEFKDCLRNRWFISVTLVFAILAVGLCYYGSASSGVIGITNIESTIASLASLGVFLIPLIALLISYDSFVGEKEAGTLLLLLTYPLSKAQLVIGKFLGQGSVIALATFIGFGSAAVLLATELELALVLKAFGIFISTAILLGLSFTALAYVVSLLASEKSKAAGIALVLWFLFALVFDLAILAMLVSSSEAISESLLTQIMLFNPTDIFRLINLAALPEAANMSDAANGAISAALSTRLSLGYLFTAMSLWVVLPLAFAIFIFRNKKL